MAAAGTSESSDAPADLLEAFNSKADVPMPERYVRDLRRNLRNSRGAAHEKESEDFAIREQRVLGSCFARVSKHEIQLSCPCVLLALKNGTATATRNYMQYAMKQSTASRLLC